MDKLNLQKQLRQRQAGIAVHFRQTPSVVRASGAVHAATPSGQAA
jgi:hypothetical protein